MQRGTVQVGATSAILKRLYLKEPVFSLGGWDMRDWTLRCLNAKPGSCSTMHPSIYPYISTMHTNIILTTPFLILCPYRQGYLQGLLQGEQDGHRAERRQQQGQDAWVYACYIVYIVYDSFMFMIRMCLCWYCLWSYDLFYSNTCPRTHHH